MFLAFMVLVICISVYIPMALLSSKDSYNNDPIIREKADWTEKEIKAFNGILDSEKRKYYEDMIGHEIDIHKFQGIEEALLEVSMYEGDWHPQFQTVRTSDDLFRIRKQVEERMESLEEYDYMEGEYGRYY